MVDLFCIGCGPGDPELLTIKAVNLIKKADVIVCPTSKEGKPSIAFSVIENFLEGRNPEVVNLVFPMTKDRDILKDTWTKNARILADYVLTGKKVVYLTIGDPYLYSTWIYLHKEIEKNFPQINVTVIPGIVSMFTFASKVGISLAEGSEKLAVIPSCYDLTQMEEIAKSCETMIFLKDGRYFDKVIEILRKAGFSDKSSFAIGQDLGTEKEIVRKLTLGEVTSASFTTKYFSIMVVKRA